MRNLLRNWDAVRIIRLLIGLAIGVYSVVAGEYVFLILAGLLIVQALMNVSCCAGGSCAPAQRREEEVYRGQIKKYKR